MSLLHERPTTDAFDGVEVAVLPTGSTEQHGPALPLGTDFLAAEAVARTASDRADAAVLPTIPVGVSAHHRQFDGTLWTDPDTFEAYVADVIESVASHGVRKAVIVNGHGGNTGALRRAARGLRDDRVAFAAPWNWWSGQDELIDDLFDASLGHAGQVETSMVLSVAEDLVREAALADAEAGGAEAWGREVHGAEVGFDAIDFTDNGAVGEPTAATREAGERLFEGAREDLDALIDWLVDRPVADLWPREHR